MTDRATNQTAGVRNIRALFEAKNETTHTSPPSRGRSPAGGSDTGGGSGRGGARSTSSRPLSKVRTSFVTVEKSGQFGPILGVRKMSATEMEGATTPPMPNVGGGDGAQEVENSTVDGEKKSSPNANGTAIAEPIAEVLEEEHADGTDDNTDGPGELANSPVAPTPSKNGTSHNPASVGDDSSPLAKKSAEAKANADQNIGSLLKGSPFVSPDTNPTDSTSTETEAVSPKKPADGKGLKPMTNGKERKAEATAQPTRPGMASKASSSRPAPVNTKKEASAAAKPPTAKSGEVNSPKTGSAPKTPISEAAGHTSKMSSPKPSADSGQTNKAKPASLKEPTKAPIRKPSRMSLASANGTASKPEKSLKISTTVDPTKKPSSTAAKPSPKSLIKPVKLPSSATAPTAASAARLNGQGHHPPSRSPSRASTTATRTKPASSTTNKKDNISTSNTTHPPATTKTRPPPASVTAPTAAFQHRIKSVRSSLGPPDKTKSEAHHNKERPKSRTSLAGGSHHAPSTTAMKPADEGFLARMMRPTASSAQKTHEKAETKSPPRKTAGSAGAGTGASGSGHGLKDKVGSGGAGKRKSEGVKGMNGVGRDDRSNGVAKDERKIDDHAEIENGGNGVEKTQDATVMDGQSEKKNESNSAVKVENADHILAKEMPDISAAVSEMESPEADAGQQQHTLAPGAEQIEA
ncbi:hypothetical protein MMC25_006290 [Agyrium rufum]|nr:hypothetical protein [Agyrium rufum]